MKRSVPRFPKPRPGRYGFEFSGGRLCLDFANTVGNRFDTPSERLESYDDFVEWARQARVLDDGAAAALEREGRLRASQADAVVRRARAAREMIFSLFSDVAQRRRPDAADVARFNAAVSSTLGHRRVAQAGDGFAWSWETKKGALDEALWPVVADAAELLISGLTDRVKHCGARPCTWLFLDTTKNASRRWCDMATCGNRAKAKRHRSRRARRD